MSIPTNGLGVCLLLVGLTAGAAIAQEPSVSVTIDSIEKTDAGFVVSGTAVAEGPVSAGHASHSYGLAVLAEIMDGDGAQYPKLADAMRIRDPEGAETSFVPGSGPGSTMTRDEYHGVNITTIRLASLGAPGTFDFTGTIPAEHAGKPFRIRAELNPQLRICGIVMTMQDRRTIHNRDVIEMVREGFGDDVMNSVIPATIRFQEAAAASLPITSYDPGGRGAEAYRSLAKEVMQRGQETKAARR